MLNKSIRLHKVQALKAELDSMNHFYKITPCNIPIGNDRKLKKFVSVKKWQMKLNCKPMRKPKIPKKWENIWLINQILQSSNLNVESFQSCLLFL